jgi:hypothetical protein
MFDLCPLFNITRPEDFLRRVHSSWQRVCRSLSSGGFGDQAALESSGYRIHSQGDGSECGIGLFDLPVFMSFCHVGQKLIALLTCQAVGKGFVEKGVTI